MNPLTNLCDGCHRTIGEIAAWATLDEAGKRAVWVELEQRRPTLHAGGRHRPGVGSTR